MSQENTPREVKMVAFNSIFFPEDENARSNPKKIEELADSIRQAGGLLEPIGVSNGGEGDKPYEAQYGFRRGLALKLLRWGDKPVPVIIVPKDKKTEFNLIENIHREDLPTIDLAQRLRDMEAGEAPGAVGKKWSKQELAKLLGKKSATHVGNLIRAINKCNRSAKDAWRKYNTPTSIVFHWAGLDDDAQESAVAAYKKEQDRIKERAEKLAGKEGGGGEGDGEGGSKTRGNKEGEDSGPTPMVKGKKAAELETAKAILEWKIAEGVIKDKAEVAEAMGQIMLIRHILGDIARFPSISAAERKAYGKWCKAQEDAATAEAEGEEEGEE